MTLDLEAIRKRAEAATPAPWKANPQRGHHEISGGGMWFAKIWWTVFGPRNHADAEFIAHARTDVPALLAEIARLEGERDAAQTTYIDDDGLCWSPPTAWAYAQSCRVREDLRARATAAESALAALRAENERLRAAALLLNKWFSQSGASISARWGRVPREERIKIVAANRAALDFRARALVEGGRDV